MAVDLDQVEMRQAIDQAGRGDLANAPKIIGVNLVDLATDKLFGAGRDAVEHLIVAIEVMNGAENEIELVPIFLDPRPSRCGRFRIVIELNAGADFDVGIRRAQFVDFIEIDSGVIAIVIGKGDVGQPACARAIDPWLEKLLGVRAEPDGPADASGNRKKALKSCSGIGDPDQSLASVIISARSLTARSGISGGCAARDIGERKLRR